MSISINFTTIIVLLINAISLLFLIFGLRRLKHYSRQMALEESQYTRMFGHVDLRTWVYAYVFFVIFYGTLLWFAVL
jgi:hypothetical protein